MNTRERAIMAAAAIMALTLAFGISGCSDKKADETTATATSPGKPGGNSASQQPSEPGKPAVGHSGMQIKAPPAPPP
jgi:hypothetical protein